MTQGKVSWNLASIVALPFDSQRSESWEHAQEGISFRVSLAISPNKRVGSQANRDDNNGGCGWWG